MYKFTIALYSCRVDRRYKTTTLVAQASVPQGSLGDHHDNSSRKMAFIFKVTL